jgi:hypothetical protein
VKPPVLLLLTQPEIAEVARGAKSQHRIRVRHPGHSGAAPHCRYSVGDLVLIERATSDGGREVALGVTINAIYRQPVDAITDPEAKAEGYKTPDQLRAARRYRTGELWVLQWEPCEVPWYLHRNPTKGYTHDPGESVEGQAVSPETLVEYARAGWDHHAETKTDEYRRQQARSRAAKLKEAENRAAKQGVDISPHVERIDGELEAINGKLGKAA